MGAATVMQSAILDSSDGIVHAFSTRQGGVSKPPFAALNLGQSVGDDPVAVEENRQRFFGGFGIAATRVVRAKQVHGDGVLRVDAELVGRTGFPRSLVDEPAEFDALITNLPGLALVVSTADCLPILIHDPIRRAVAAVHAGWRGTAKRIAARALVAMRRGIRDGRRRLPRGDRARDSSLLFRGGCRRDRRDVGRPPGLGGACRRRTGPATGFWILPGSTGRSWNRPGFAPTGSRTWACARVAGTICFSRTGRKKGEPDG